MKFNKLFKILLLISVICLFMGAVAAADDVDSHAVGAEDGNLAVEHEDVSDKLQSSDDEVLSAGNSWYVKAGASGGDGSETSPYSDIKSVTNNANYKENDVIYVMDGTYKGAKNRNIDLKENTTVKAYEGANPIFDAQKQESIFVLSKNGITLQGLTLINGGGVVATTAQGANNWCGGAICNSGNNLTVDGCTIKTNDPITYGGGIYSKGKNTQITNSNFEGCEATYGGAIAIDGPYAKIINNKFENNAGSQGGAINIYNYGGALIADNSFTRNRASNGYAGGIYARAGDNLIKNNTFDHNTAKSYGGAIITVNPNNVIDNCTFTNNQIFNDNSNANFGGAIYSQGFNTTISNSKFSNNAVRDNGGAIYVRNSDNLIENCSFDKNWAARGGAIYIAPVVSGKNITNVTVNNCIFDKNGVDESKGGAIFSYAQNIHFIDSTFEGNVGLSSGAIQLVGNDNTIEGCTFKNNIANHYGGGAISSASTGDTVSNCVFENNRAMGYGGAISMNYVTVVDSIFNENSADHGGAIYTINATLKNCEFNENQANNNWVVLAEDTLELSGNKNLGELVIIDNDLLMATSATPQIPVQFGNNEKIKITTSEDGNIAYADGYVAYCVEELTDAPTFGVLRSDVSAVKNAVTQEQVGEYLKLLVYHYGDKYEYEDFAKLVHIFTETDYTSSDNEIVKDVLARFNNGESLPDVYIEKQDDGSFVQYTFKSVIVPQATQNLLLYNISSVVPNMTVEKISNNVTAKVGDLVSFDITVNNTGNCTLTGVYVIDSDYTDGLKYDHFVDETGKWSYEGNGKFVYKGALKANQTAKFTVVFEALTEGFKVNNVTAGNNLTNDTVNSTNTTNVTVVPKNETDVPENETDVPENETDVPENKTVDHKKVTKTTKAKTVKSNVENATGNPLLLLLAALIIPVIRFKRK